jgi:aryl-alcohol dehydrogenase-like predicted oxidoreductase
MNRRRFLQHATVTAAASAAGMMACERAKAESKPPASATLPQRVLGRTKEKVSLLGIGIAPLGSNSTTPAQAEAVVHAALDAGITYVDVSPDYGDAEAKLRPVLQTRRKEIFLVTKVNPQQPDKAGVLAQIEESLKRMGTDHIDAVHIHNLGDWDMEKLFAPDGGLSGLQEARKRGLIRFIGTSGHMRPPRFVRAIESGQIDLTMNVVNFADRTNYAFEETVFPAARKQGTALVAMKVLGGAKNWRYDGKTAGCLAEHHEKAIRYSLGVEGVACAVIGLSSVSEVQQAVQVARAYKPLTNDERMALLETGKTLAQARGLYYGPVTG